MIEEIKAYKAECSICKTKFEDGEFNIFSDKATLVDNMNDYGWYTVGDACICPDCHEKTPDWVMNTLDKFNEWLKQMSKESESKEKSSFFDLKKAETCLHPEHDPPMHLYIPPGREYKHVCPKCGHITIIKNNF